MPSFSERIIGDNPVVQETNPSAGGDLGNRLNALRAGVLDMHDIPAECVSVLGDSYSSRINTMITSIIENSLDRPFLKMGDEVGDASDALRKFMFEHVYLVTSDAAMDRRVLHVMQNLYEHFRAHMDELPDSYATQCESFGDAVAVSDYIAGMTDRYAVAKFGEVFLPMPAN